MNWSQITRQLICYTFKRRNRMMFNKFISDEDCKDIAQEALTRLFDPAYRPVFDPDCDEDTLWHALNSLVNGIINNIQCKRRTRRRLIKKVVATHQIEQKHPRADTTRLVWRMLLAWLVERATMTHDTLAALGCHLSGRNQSREIAAHYNWNIKRAYKAQKQLKIQLARARLTAMDEPITQIEQLWGYV